MLEGLIAKVHEALGPLEEEYHQLQEKLDILKAEMDVNAAKRWDIKDNSDLATLERELADVSRDITKLLRKKRS